MMYKAHPARAMGGYVLWIREIRSPLGLYRTKGGFFKSRPFDLPEKIYYPAEFMLFFGLFEWRHEYPVEIPLVDLVDRIKTADRGVAGTERIDGVAEIDKR